MKHFYEKNGYLIFSAIGIIFASCILMLNAVGIISEKMCLIIVGPLALVFIGVFIYMIHCAIKDKKLRDQAQRGEPKVIVEPSTSIFKKPGDAIIDIDGFKYFIESPFIKEGAYPKKNDTFYSYLSSFRLIKPFSKKMIKWFKKDMELPDTVMNENYLCYHFKDLSVADCNNPLFLFCTCNEKMRLIIAIELLEINAEVRGLEHISALINTASAHERKNYAGGGLLDAFDLFENGEITPKVFKQWKSVGYCFLSKNYVW